MIFLGKIEAEVGTIENKVTDKTRKTILENKRKTSTFTKLSYAHFLKKVNATKALIAALPMVLNSSDAFRTFTKPKYVMLFREESAKSRVTNANMLMAKNK